MGLLGSKLPYAETFAAIGRMVAKKQLSDVCVMEFEDGVIVTGSMVFVTGDRFSRKTETLVLSADDLKRLSKEA